MFYIAINIVHTNISSILVYEQFYIGMKEDALQKYYQDRYQINAT